MQQNNGYPHSLAWNIIIVSNEKISVTKVSDQVDCIFQMFQVYQLLPYQIFQVWTILIISSFIKIFFRSITLDQPPARHCPAHSSTHAAAWGYHYWGASHSCQYSMLARWHQVQTVWSGKAQICSLLQILNDWFPQIYPSPAVIAKSRRCHKRVALNVGGVRHEVTWKLLEQYPQSRKVQFKCMRNIWWGSNLQVGISCQKWHTWRNHGSCFWLQPDWQWILFWPASKIFQLHPQFLQNWQTSHQWGHVCLSLPGIHRLSWIQLII